ncbi:MAG: class I SAM-dependent methyltransferase [Leptospiraceae bacterium]|nr:class I SAM-dependent methyltransferase [Leptospiraceae bacterium]
MNTIVKNTKSKSADAENNAGLSDTDRQNATITHSTRIESDPPRASVPAPTHKPGGVFERIFLYALRNNQSGGLLLRFPDDSTIVLGHGTIQATLEVRDRRLFRHSVLFGEIGFGEAYVEGWWDSPQPMAVLDWFMRNHSQSPSFSGGGVRQLYVNLLGWINRCRHYLRSNTRRMSRRNISDHYDLSNDFFKLWLDESMAYSSGIFLAPDDSLTQAQQNKFAAIARKLQLHSGDHVLEIGCGWGGFALYAARNHQCRVTGITISREQYDYARDHVQSEGLEHLIDIQLCDYRDLSTENRYSKIVSIEMVEALGREYLDTFFRQCNRLLKPDGLMLIQCITFPDPYYADYVRNVDWTQIHIFPGSLLLSLRETMNSLHRTGDLMALQVESIGPHYARTLREWRRNFNARLQAVSALGFDERFVRKWNYYLMFCETGFAARYINDMQILFSRPTNRDWLPEVR